MGIARNQFNNILKEIFKEGNRIELLSTMPSPTTDTGERKISGTGYESYTIKSGDFNVSTGEVSSAKNMMLYLCESTSGHGTAVGFGVYGSGGILYYGTFKSPISIDYNTVPTIKKFDSAKGEGIKITMTSTEVSV